MFFPLYSGMLQMTEMKRVFMYPAQSTKLFRYENEEELTIENVKSKAVFISLRNKLYGAYAGLS